MRLIVDRNEKEAKDFFNKKIFGKYIFSDFNSPLIKLAWFFYELDDYFNNEAWRLMRGTNKEEIVELYQRYLNEISDLGTSAKKDKS